MAVGERESKSGWRESERLIAEICGEYIHTLPIIRNNLIIFSWCQVWNVYSVDQMQCNEYIFFSLDLFSYTILLFIVNKDGEIQKSILLGQKSIYFSLWKSFTMPTIVRFDALQRAAQWRIAVYKSNNNNKYNQF